MKSVVSLTTSDATYGRSKLKDHRLEVGGVSATSDATYGRSKLKDHRLEVGGVIDSK